MTGSVVTACMEAVYREIAVFANIFSRSVSLEEEVVFLYRETWT